MRVLPYIVTMAIGMILAYSCSTANQTAQQALIEYQAKEIADLRDVEHQATAIKRSDQRIYSIVCPQVFDDLYEDYEEQSEACADAVEQNSI